MESVFHKIRVSTGPICVVESEKTAILFPNLDATEKWIAKADVIPALKNAKVSTWLEKHSTPEEKLQDLDIGDYLVRLPAWRKLRLEDFI